MAPRTRAIAEEQRRAGPASPTPQPGAVHPTTVLDPVRSLQGQKVEFSWEDPPLAATVHVYEELIIPAPSGLEALVVEPAARLYAH